MASELPPDYGPKPVAAPSSLVGQEILPVALVAMFVGLATIIGIALLTTVETDGRAGRISRRLSFYSLTGRQPQKQSESTTTTVLGPRHRAIRRGAGGSGRGERRIEPVSVPARQRRPVAQARRVDAHPSRRRRVRRLALPALVRRRHRRDRTRACARLDRPSGVPCASTITPENAFLSQLPETLQLMAGPLVGYSRPRPLTPSSARAPSP